MRDLECLVDRYEDALGSYLLRITPTELTQEQNKSLHKFLHAITDFERISDHANNIADSAKEIFDKQLEFSQASQHELDVLAAAVKEIVDLTISAFVDNDLELALQVEPLEELIDVLCADGHQHPAAQLRLQRPDDQLRARGRPLLQRRGGDDRACP